MTEPGFRDADLGKNTMSDIGHSYDPELIPFLALTILETQLNLSCIPQMYFGSETFMNIH